MTEKDAILIGLIVGSVVSIIILIVVEAVIPWSKKRRKL